MRPTLIALAIAHLYPITLSPTLAERPEHLHETFRPLDRVLDQIEADGEIETARGYPVFQDDRGWYEIAPAVEGIVDFHEIIQHRTGRPIDLGPLRTLASRLKNGVLLDLADIKRTRQCIAACKTHAASLTIAEASDILNSIRISWVLEKAA